MLIEPIHIAAVDEASETVASAAASTLLTLKRHEPAVVRSVHRKPGGAFDLVARRLYELGFVPGEPVKVVAVGPLGGDPLLVQIGFTRFALRRSEAARVEVTREISRLDVTRGAGA